MKVCVDAGHGMSNRKAGVYDPGCTHVEAGVTFNEANIVLSWAGELEKELRERGHEVVLTRANKNVPIPVWKRAGVADAAGCDLLISIHVNDAEDDEANGSEVLYFPSSTRGMQLAQLCLSALTEGLSLRSRGLKPRNDLAVLKGRSVAVLLELGFIANDIDRGAMLDEELRRYTCSLLADAISLYGNNS